MLYDYITDKNPDLNYTMTPIRKKQALIKKLETAYKTCFDCGHKYGVYSVGCSSVYVSKCGVCGEVKPITETRDFGFFMTSISKLKLEIQCTKKKS